MSTPINLNKVRKAKARAEKSARAEVNMVKFGRTKTQKQADITATASAQRLLDGHKRDP